MSLLHGPHTPQRFRFLLATVPDDDPPPADEVPFPAVTPDDGGEEEEGQGEEFVCCWQSVSAR